MIEIMLDLNSKYIIQLFRQIQILKEKILNKNFNILKRYA